MASTLDSISSALQTYVVSPLNAFGMGGFVFDVAGESVAQLQSEITDHYTEDNRALQDHIAIRPKRIVLKGYVGELVHRISTQDNSPVQKLTQKLTVINSYLPQLSSAAQQTQALVTNPSAASFPLSAAANIFGLTKNMLQNNGNGPAQQNAYAYFQALQAQGVLMGIQTPWEFLTNMAIETIVAIQTEESNGVTDFSITFKQIRIAETQTLDLGIGGDAVFDQFADGVNGAANSVVSTVKDGATALQTSVENQLGIIPGLNLPYSSLPGTQKLMVNGSSFKALKGIGNLFSLE